MRRSVAAGSVLIVLAGVAVGVSVVPARAEAPFPPAGRVLVSTPSQPGAWSGYTGTTSQIVDAPLTGTGLPAAGLPSTGYLEFDTAAGQTVGAQTLGGRVPLKSFTSGSLYVRSAQGAYVAYTLTISTTKGWVPIYWTPGNNGAGWGAGDPSWHHYDVTAAGNWYSASPIPGDTRSNAANPVPVPLAKIIAANPKSTIVEYGLTQMSAPVAVVSDVNAYTYATQLRGQPQPAVQTTFFEPDGAQYAFSRVMQESNLALDAYPIQLYMDGPATITAPDVKATLSFNFSASPAGRTIVFYTGDQYLCQAVTDAQGVAECVPGGLTFLSIVLDNGYSAVFAGDSGTTLPAGAQPNSSAGASVQLLTLRCYFIFCGRTQH